MLFDFFIAGKTKKQGFIKWLGKRKVKEIDLFRSGINYIILVCS